jgi:hypothetical protein
MVIMLVVGHAVPPNLRAHGRVLVGADLGQIPSREEEKCVVLSQIAVEDAPILRGDDLEVLYPAGMSAVLAQLETK